MGDVRALRARGACYMLGMGPQQPPPEGDWHLSCRRDALKRSFWIIARDPIVADEVRARLILGDLAGYSRRDWGLPAALSRAKIWHLQHITPRQALAGGGTKALVHHLSQLADKGRAWITTEVKTRANNDPAVMHLLRKHAKFESPDPQYPQLMIRRPGLLSD